MSIASPPTALPSIWERLSDAAPDHDRLIQACLDAEHVEQAIPKTRSRIESLSKLVFTTTLELNISDRCRDSTGTKLEACRSEQTTLNRVSGSIFWRRDHAQEIRELEERYEKEGDIVKIATRTLTRYKGWYRDAQSQLETLERKRADHTSALAALDALHDSVFGGPTPEFPLEDHHELLVAGASHELQDRESKVDKERNASLFLRETRPLIQMLVRYLEDAAESTSQRTLDSKYETVSEPQEDALKSAKNIVHAIDELVEKARAESPHVYCRGGIEIPDVSSFDVDMHPSSTSLDTSEHLVEFRDALRRVQDDVEAWSKRLDREAERSEERRARLERKVDRAKDELDREKTELRLVRQDIFDQAMKELPGYGGAI